MYVPVAPIVLGIDLTSRCNINCKYCAVEAKELGEDLPFDRVLSLIKEAAALKVRWLDLNGGEPLLYPGFFELVEYASLEGLQVMFISNGLLLEEQMGKVENFFAKYHSKIRIGLSLDGATPEQHGFFRPRDTFKSVVRVVKHLVEKKFAVIVFSVLHKQNLDHVLEFLCFLKKLGVSRIRFLPLMPLGRGRAWKDLILSKEDVWSIAKKRREWEKVFGAPVYFETLYEFLLLKEKRQKPSPCLAGYYQLGINTKGEYFPCGYMMNLSLGSIYNSSILDVWQNSPVLNALRDSTLLKGVCANCPYRDRCRGGCRGLAYLMEGDYLCPDPYCPLVAQSKEELG